MQSFVLLGCLHVLALAARGPVLEWMCQSLIRLTFADQGK
jgi:hypothetical protein